MKSKDCFEIKKSSLQDVRRDKDADIKDLIVGLIEMLPSGARA
jgi:hypothetical protein